MLKRGSNRICNNPKPEACSNCFAGLDLSLFQQRKAAAQTALKSCDGLISPSNYLLGVMQQQFWLPAHTRVIENGLPLKLLRHYQQIKDETNNATPSLNRFAFFGRASERKGLLVMLQACYLLSLSHLGLFQLQIFGGGLEQEPAAIQHRIHALIAACGDHVELSGRYRQRQIPQLMQQCDWVICPSIWWENSPVVIQEAFACHKPVIGSNHGGIAEKINGRGGLGFQPNDAADLARRMKEAIGNEQLHQCLQEQMAPPFSIETCAAQHLEFYEELMQNHACR
jgi:glycosyltransferase involved in cell wall biosynthesis